MFTFGVVVLLQMQRGCADLPETCPRALGRATLPRMQQRCEICSNFLSPTRIEASRARVEEHVIESRRVWLCGTHSLLVRELLVETVGELRSLFRENDGRRSLLPRRRAENGTVGDERRARGRRATDRIPN